MPIPPPCAEPSEHVPIDGAADVAVDAGTRLVGTWIRCDGDTRMWWAYEGDDVGYEFADDGRFFRLYQDENGGLIRAEGLLQEGEWTIDRTIAGEPIVWMALTGSGSMGHLLSFFAEPQAIRLVETMGPAIRTFVRWSGAAPAPGWPASLGEGPCSVRTLPVEVDSVEDAATRLVGTWIRCGDGPRLFWAFEGDDVGFEFTADGRFFRVYEGADGGLIRSEGFAQEGRWQIDDLYDGFTVALGMDLHGSGYFNHRATFHEEPVALRIIEEMVFTATHYVPWSGAEPEPGLPTDVGDGPCGHATDHIVLESSAQTEDLLTGTWTVCGGEPFGPAVIGVEFAADGDFRALVHAADGQVVPDAMSVGATWLVHRFDEPFDIHNGPQLDIRYADGSTRIASPRFFATPPFVAFGVGAGLVEGTPAALSLSPPDALPPTGRDASWELALLAGALVVVGWVSVRVTRRSTFR